MWVKKKNRALTTVFYVHRQEFVYSPSYASIGPMELEKRWRKLRRMWMFFVECQTGYQHGVPVKPLPKIMNIRCLILLVLPSKPFSNAVFSTAAYASHSYSPLLSSRQKGRSYSCPSVENLNFHPSESPLTSFARSRRESQRSAASSSGFSAPEYTLPTLLVRRKSMVDWLFVNEKRNYKSKISRRNRKCITGMDGAAIARTPQFDRSFMLSSEGKRNGSWWNDALDSF